MGVKIITGYKYSCSNCGHKLHQTSTIEKLLFPINFDYKVKRCDNCGSPYIDTSCMEFFTVTKKGFYGLFFMSLFFWIITIEIIFASIMAITEISCPTIIYIGLPIIIAPIYYIAFLYHWDKGKQDSIRRINDDMYLVDLVLANILTLDLIDTMYEGKLIAPSVYEHVKDFFSQQNRKIIIENDNVDTQRKTKNIDTFIESLSFKTNLPYNICEDIYYILTNFNKDETDIANNIIETKLIPDLKLNNNYGQVSVAFGCLINEKGLTQEQANELSITLMTEMVTNKEEINNGN